MVAHCKLISRYDHVAVRAELWLILSLFTILSQFQAAVAEERHVAFEFDGKAYDSNGTLIGPMQLSDDEKLRRLQRVVGRKAIVTRTDGSVARNATVLRINPNSLGHVHSVAIRVDGWEQSVPIQNISEIDVGSDVVKFEAYTKLVMRMREFDIPAGMARILERDSEIDQREKRLEDRERVLEEWKSKTRDIERALATKSSQLSDRETALARRATEVDLKMTEVNKRVRLFEHPEEAVTIHVKLTKAGSPVMGTAVEIRSKAPGAELIEVLKTNTTGQALSLKLSAATISSESKTIQIVVPGYVVKVQTLLKNELHLLVEAL